MMIIIVFCLIRVESRGDNKENDTIKNYIPFLQIKYAGGTVLPTSPIVEGNKTIEWFNAASLRFGYQATGRRWQDRIYKMPEMGVGVHFTNFYRNNDIGKPIALYVFYGAEWKRFNSRLSLNYELNLGYSMDWKPYNAVSNPQNGAIGAKWAIFAAFESHIVWQINPYFDLLLGIMISHYSNGGTRKPNNGLNMISPTISLRYNFQQSTFKNLYNIELRDFKPYIAQDVSFNLAFRQLMIEVPENKNNEKVPLNYNFEVYGLNYNCYYVPNYNYKYGISVHFIYDSSSNAEIKLTDNTGIVRESILKRKLSLGVAAYGEISTEHFSIFANIGYNVIHNQSYDSRIYQILGVKYYLFEKLYATIGVNANGFSSAKYLFLSMGYTFR